MAMQGWLYDVTELNSLWQQTKDGGLIIFNAVLWSEVSLNQYGEVGKAIQEYAGSIDEPLGVLSLNINETNLTLKL